MRGIAGVLVAVALLYVGCSGDKPAGAPEATTPAEGAPADPGAAAAVPGGEFGVPECDQFARKYLACLDKVPEGGRALARQTFEQTIEHWRLAAEKPAGRANLAAACAQQEKATRAAMSRYDCDW